ncbi:MAG TPA: MATE family efflux transporter [Bryobacteraceae bacterium]|jgi:MATE family multidrug resistance protein|nr:MATE family efflux transporter [Bryobacteraceae bacterium]
MHSIGQLKNRHSSVRNNAVKNNVDFWRDVRRVLQLSIPVALGELGWVAMGTVDTIMVGGLGAPAIGAIGIGSSAFYTLAIFGFGLLFGLDTLVSHSYGAGDRNDCHHSLAQGIYIAVGMTPVLMLLYLLMPPFFRVLKIDPSVAQLAGPFLRTLSLSTLPLILYAALRRYLQAIGHVRPIMFTLISANVINWFFNWLLIRGNWGLPALGVVGSALSTTLARVYMAATLAFFIWWFERDVRKTMPPLWRKPDWVRITRLLRIGFPAAVQILFEVGAFGTAAVFAGKVSADAMAAHQIALNCAAIAFMVPLGISSATAVAVGQAIGARKPMTARRSGFIAIGLGGAFMCCTALAFFLVPRQIIHFYTYDPAVVSVAVRLLGLAALFQLFDGIQTVATGALRGLGNTQIAMTVNFVCYWVAGLPLGYWLCFVMLWGIYGVWIGLTLALIGTAILLLIAYNYQSRIVLA